MLVLRRRPEPLVPAERAAGYTVARVGTPAAVARDLHAHQWAELYRRGRSG